MAQGDARHLFGLRGLFGTRQANHQEAAANNDQLGMVNIASIAGGRDDSHTCERPLTQA
jgi:hypothetical protein